MTVKLEKMLRVDDVMSVTGLKKSTLFRWISDGRFPPSVKLGPRAVAWRESDVAAWQAGLSTERDAPLSARA